jgi:hypothetical protein
MSRTLYLQGKSHRYPLCRRLGGLQIRSGRGGEEKYPSLPLPGIGSPVVTCIDAKLFVT